MKTILVTYSKVDWPNIADAISKLHQQYEVILYCVDEHVGDADAISHALARSDSVFALHRASTSGAAQTARAVDASGKVAIALSGNTIEGLADTIAESFSIEIAKELGLETKIGPVRVPSLGTTVEALVITQDLSLPVVRAIETETIRALASQPRLISDSRDVDAKLAFAVATEARRTAWTATGNSLVLGGSLLLVAAAVQYREVLLEWLSSLLMAAKLGSTFGAAVRVDHNQRSKKQEPKLTNDACAVVLAPRSVVLGSTFEVHCSLVMPEFEVAEKADLRDAVDPDEPHRSYSLAAFRGIAEGEIIRLQLDAAGLDVLTKPMTREWQRGGIRVQFFVRVPPASDIKGKAVLRLALMRRDARPVEIEFGVAIKSSGRPDPLAAVEYQASCSRKWFLSYSTDDYTAVNAHRLALDEHGTSNWFDQRDLGRGENHREKLPEFIRKSDGFRLFWSDNSAASDEVKCEFLVYRDHAKAQQLGGKLPPLLDLFELHADPPPLWQELRDIYPGTRPEARAAATRRRARKAASSERRVGTTNKSDAPHFLVGCGQDDVKMPIEGGVRFRDAPMTPEMMVVPSGSYWRGAPENEFGWTRHEAPRQEVKINYALAVGIYQVTFKNWDTAVHAADFFDNAADLIDNMRLSNRPWRHPVTHITWRAANAYTRWLSIKTGKKYRLLSEAEWEYACRAGSDGPFSGINARSDVALDCELANFSGDYPWPGKARKATGKTTLPVGSFPPNDFGLFDMHGNVWEWVADHWFDTYEEAPTDGRPRLSSDTTGYRVIRGGSFMTGSRCARSAFRGKSPEQAQKPHTVGFRVAREL